MSGTVIYGSELAKQYKADLKVKIDTLKQEGKRIPCLAVIVVGDDPASLSYVRGKKKALAEVGIIQKLFHLPADISQNDLEKILKQCNQDEDVDGILLQLPLPSPLNSEHAISVIDPEKDVDGLHVVNVGRLYEGKDGFVPCTPMGIMALLNYADTPIAGARAVVIGRSNLVGAPAARLLQNANATVTVCHSHTSDTKAICKQADILVVAVGKPKFIDHTYIKEGATVIDVGINRLPDGHLCGDVDFDDVIDHVRAITPVPKGVGPMTICMLLENTLKAYQRRTGVC